MNIGEELVAAYLQHIKGCAFTQQNLRTPDVQGEIDVTGIDTARKTLYVCEVAIHLSTGLLYTKGGKPDNLGRLGEKFSRDIEYARKYFPHHRWRFMLWSPIIRQSGEHAILNQQRDVEMLARKIQSKYDIALECAVNEDFQHRLDELQEFARNRSEEINNPVLRLFQIEEALKDI